MASDRIRDPSLGEHPPLAVNDVMLDGLAQRVVSDVHRFFSKERLEREAMHDERQRLARELHDGVLQSLAAIGLKLEALSRLVAKEPDEAAVRLAEVQELLGEEQRELRAWIERLRPAQPVAMASAAELTDALNKLCRRAEWQWGISVELAIARQAAVPRALGDAVFRIVQEALTNIGRHAQARIARVGLRPGADHVALTIADDGVGFSFRGQYDLQALKARGIGPVSLRERVASLNGQMTLSSTLSGSEIEIRLPVQSQLWSGARTSRGSG